MTLDDETAGRIADEKARERGDYNGVGQTIPLGEYVKAGYAARDAEVEELRAERDRLRDAVESTDRMVESFEKWCTRALTAEATLAKLREWAEVSDRPHIESWDLGYEHATLDVLAILDESPTERETPADEVLSGRIVTASFETGEPWPCGLEDCECPEHDSPAPPKGTYVTVRLDDEEVPVGLWPVRIARVPEARGEVVPDDRA